MQEAYTISVPQAAQLLQKSQTTVRELIQSGKISAQSFENANRGRGGLVYRIPLDALPIDAQIRYYEETGRAAVQLRAGEEQFDLGAYAKKAGEDGMRKLLGRQQAVLRLMTDSALYDEYAANAPARIRRDFDIEKLAEKVLETYQ